MKGRGTRFLARAMGLLLLVPLVLAMAGCGSDGEGGGGGNKDAIAIMKRLPQGANSVMFMDMKALRTDKDLKEMYDEFSQDTGGIATEMMPGISMATIDAFAMAGEMIFILTGTFDLAEIRQGLEDQEYTEAMYNDVELWKSDFFSMVLVDSKCIIMASEDDAKDCIDVIAGVAKSLWEKAGVKDDIEKLPGTSLLVGWGSGEDAIFADSEYPGLVTAGVSLSKKSADKLQASAVIRFTDAASAKAAMADIETSMTEDDPDVTNVKVSQDGSRIKASADVKIGASLFW